MDPKETVTVNGTDIEQLQSRWSNKSLLLKHIARWHRLIRSANKAVTKDGLVIGVDTNVQHLPPVLAS